MSPLVRRRSQGRGGGTRRVGDGQRSRRTVCPPTLPSHIRRTTGSDESRRSSGGSGGSGRSGGGDVDGGLRGGEVGEAVRVRRVVLHQGLTGGEEIAILRLTQLAAPALGLQQQRGQVQRRRGGRGGGGSGRARGSGERSRRRGGRRSQRRESKGGHGGKRRHRRRQRGRRRPHSGLSGRGGGGGRQPDERLQSGADEARQTLQPPSALRALLSLIPWATVRYRSCRVLCALPLQIADGGVLPSHTVGEAVGAGTSAAVGIVAMRRGGRAGRQHWTIRGRGGGGGGGGRGGHEGGGRGGVEGGRVQQGGADVATAAEVAAVAAHRRGGTFERSFRR